MLKNLFSNSPERLRQRELAEAQADLLKAERLAEDHAATLIFYREQVRVLRTRIERLKTPTQGSKQNVILPR